MSSAFNPEETKKTLKTPAGDFSFFKILELKKLGFAVNTKLPFSLKVLLECLIRNYDNYEILIDDIQKLAGWSPHKSETNEIAFKPGRVLLQDFTGIPCIVDLAAMRSAMKERGGDYRKINPQVPCDLVVDHSVQVDSFGTNKAFAWNVKKEFERNKERYEFLKWGQKAFKNFRVIPPATGIVHQVNLEYLAQGVMKKRMGKETIIYPDSLVGTDSHTTMINGLGIVGWGVGGIEAEAVMLGEPIFMLTPQVVGFQLQGQLKEGATATDLVLMITQILRKHGVVDKFVEFFGEGLNFLSLPDRATIANMAPEYGAIMGFFPVDQETLAYYQMTGRSPQHIDLIERYMKEQEMFYVRPGGDPEFTESLELDLSSVTPGLAGPKRPQDRVTLSEIKKKFTSVLREPENQGGFGLMPEDLERRVPLRDGAAGEISHGTVVIAAITSCTNTSNPSVLVGAGLLAKNAVERGLSSQSYVKTSFAPGSRVAYDYLQEAGLMPYLEKLGFNLVGYGCTTCIGNSGPLPASVAEAIQKGDLVAVSVLSGNRNFEGRINPLTKASYLASPPLVVAYALAGRIDVDLTKEPLGKDKQGRDVYLKDIWPTQQEINEVISNILNPKLFQIGYQDVLKGDENWNSIETTASDLYEWKKTSTYIQEPPFFENIEEKPRPIEEIKGGRVLVKLGDSITTDHISPAGSIAENSPAGRYLKEQGIEPVEFNTYGARRGNDRVMTRGTFANIRLKNLLVPGEEGSRTVYFPDNTMMSIYDAALLYKKDKTPLLVLAGKEYGAGSSRDWAAKGTALLGVRVVLAQSYERIHRINLIGMGVLPLQFKDEDSAQALGLKGDESFDFIGLNDHIKPRQDITVVSVCADGTKKEFKTIACLNTPVEIDYYRNGGILPTVLRKLAKS